MTLSDHPTARWPRAAALLLVGLWALSACSESGDGDSGQAQGSTDAPASAGVDTPAEPTTSPIVNDGLDDPVEDTPAPIIDTPEAQPVVDAPTDTDVDEPAVNDPVVADTPLQGTVLVTFDMTVPAYQSDELRVKVAWGDIELDASWIGDEFWSASGEFPSNTAHALTVTFYDSNGDLPLASFRQEFRTGANAAESIQVAANQFDASQFDADRDGLSNLDELIAGASPLVDEDALLEVLDSYTLNYHSRMSVSRDLELRLAADRPLFDTFEPDPAWLEQPDYPRGRSGEIDIDAQGNGTLTYNDYSGVERLSLTATRTRSDNSVSWEGVRSAYDGDYGHRVDVFNTVSVIDEDLRGYTEYIVGSNIGTYTYRWLTRSDLTGRRIDGSSLCQLVAGTVSHTYRTWPGESVVVTAISKEIDDAYWRVIRTDNQAETREFFVRELIVLDDRSDPDNAHFACDFVDID